LYALSIVFMQQMIYPLGQKDISSHIIKLEAANISQLYLLFLVVVTLIFHLGDTTKNDFLISFS
jgi:hypothetical protein